MHPILFHIPGLDFPIRSFGVLLASGYLIGNWLLGRLAARYGDDPQGDPVRYGNVAVWVLVGVVLGARLMYVAVELAKGGPEGQAFLANPLSALAIWKGGLVMYGGMFGAMAMGVWAAKKHGVRPKSALDLGLTAGFFGQAVGRIGCLLVGDDFGSEVPARYQDLPFPITLKVPEVLPPFSLFGDDNAGKVLWATQPWMTINAALIGCFGLWLLSRRRYRGQVSLWLVLVYAVTRSVIEAFRGDSVRGTWFDGALSTSQFISILAGLIALALIFMGRGKRDPDLPAPASNGGPSAQGTA